MGPATEDVYRAALALSGPERWELVEALLLVTPAPVAEELPFDPSWLDEARRRGAELEAGAVRLESWSVVRERVRRRLEGRQRG